LRGWFGKVNLFGTQVFETDNFDALSTRIKESLEPELFRTACEGFCMEPTEGFQIDVARHIRGGHLYVVTTNNCIEGFAMIQRFPDYDSVYLAGLVKTTRAPSGIIERIVQEFLDKNNPTNVITRTQNDRVAEIMVKVCEEVVPLDRMAEEKDIELLQNIGLFTPITDPSTLIVKNYYGRPMIGSTERKRSVNSRVIAVTDQLDYRAGDALLLVGYRR